MRPPFIQGHEVFQRVHIIRYWVPFPVLPMVQCFGVAFSRVPADDSQLTWCLIRVLNLRYWRDRSRRSFPLSSSRSLWILRHFALYCTEHLDPRCMCESRALKHDLALQEKERAKENRWGGSKRHYHGVAWRGVAFSSMILSADERILKAGSFFLFLSLSPCVCVCGDSPNWRSVCGVDTEYVVGQVTEGYFVSRGAASYCSK